MENILNEINLDKKYLPDLHLYLWTGLNLEEISVKVMILKVV